MTPRNPALALAGRQGPLAAATGLSATKIVFGDFGGAQSCGCCERTMPACQTESWIPWSHPKNGRCSSQAAERRGRWPAHASACKGSQSIPPASDQQRQDVMVFEKFVPEPLRLRTTPSHAVPLKEWLRMLGGQQGIGAGAGDRARPGTNTRGCRPPNITNHLLPSHPPTEVFLAAHVAAGFSFRVGGTAACGGVFRTGSATAVVAEPAGLATKIPGRAFGCQHCHELTLGQLGQAQCRQ